MGLFSKILGIGGAILGTALGGPVGAAIGGALGTGLGGGKKRDILLSGATSGIGAWAGGHTSKFLGGSETMGHFMGAGVGASYGSSVSDRAGNASRFSSSEAQRMAQEHERRLREIRMAKRRLRANSPYSMEGNGYLPYLRGSGLDRNDLLGSSTVGDQLRKVAESQITDMNQRFFSPPEATRRWVARYGLKSAGRGILTDRIVE
jgi:hypothetical protein